VLINHEDIKTSELNRTATAYTRDTKGLPYTTDADLFV
jgi:hypothetical protein